MKIILFLIDGANGLELSFVSGPSKDWDRAAIAIDVETGFGMVNPHLTGKGQREFLRLLDQHRSMAKEYKT